VSVAVTGFEVIDDLRGLESTLQRGLLDDAPTISQPAIEQAKIYGEEAPGQSYQRTGNLSEGWESSEVTAKITGVGVLIERENPVEYAMFVQGVGTQAGSFGARWDDLQEVANKAEAATVDRATASVADSLRGAF
jgi:hypothetical protein